LRLDDRFAKFVSLLDCERVSEGFKSRFDSFSPIWKAGNGVISGSICSNCDAVTGGLSVIKVEDTDSCSIKVVGYSVDMFKFVCGHLIITDMREISFQILFRLMNASKP
jgi:hypothetical protein